MRMKFMLAPVLVAISAAASADDSYTAIAQDGNANYGFIEQWDATNSAAQIYQSGNGNFVGLRNVPGGQYDQLGIVQIRTSNADAYVFQGGDANGAWVLQSNGANLKAVISQGGAFIDYETGEFTDGGPSYGSYGRVDQRGFDNDARILQFGSANGAYVLQNGAGGETNVARITQIGNGNIGSVTQSGAGNRGVIYQH